MNPLRLWLRTNVELPLVQAWERKRFIGYSWRRRYRNWQHARAYDRAWDAATVVGEAHIYTRLSTRPYATVPLKLIDGVATLRWRADRAVTITSVGVNHRDGKKIARYSIPARALKLNDDWELELRGLA